MDNKKERYLYAFNQLAEIIRFGDLVNMYCRDVEDCERTLEVIECVIERMNRLIKNMESA